MGFIRTLLIIFLVWQVFKWAAKWYLRYLVKKNGGKGFFYTSQSYGQPQGNQRSTGDIKVESFARPAADRSKANLDQVGDYVDFEEVK